MCSAFRRKTNTYAKKVKSVARHRSWQDSLNKEEFFAEGFNRVRAQARDPVFYCLFICFPPSHPVLSETL
jgi:hypothetical protein